MRRLGRIVAPAIVLAVAAALGAAACARPGGGSTAVEVAVLTAPDMLMQLESGDIDGFVAWEPFPATAVNGGYGKILELSGDIWPDHPCCVLAVAPTPQGKSMAGLLAEAHIKATGWMNDPANRAKLLGYAAEFTGKSQEVVEASLKDIVYGPEPNVQGLKDYYAQLKQYQLLKKTPAELGFETEEAFFEDFIDLKTYEEVESRVETDAPRRQPRSWLARDRNKTRITYIAGDIHHLAYFVAKKEGFYDDVGLRLGDNLVEVAPFPNGAAIMEAFKNGQIDAAYLGGAPATLKRINDDTKITVIASVNDLGSALVVGAKSDIAAPEQLAGRTVAVPGPGTVQDVLLRRLLAETGLTYQLKQ